MFILKNKCITALSLALDQTSCAAPHVPKAQPANELKTSYSPGETQRFVCDSGYDFEGMRYALCDDGSWNLPVCKCKSPHCKHD